MEMNVDNKGDNKVVMVEDSSLNHDEKGKDDWSINNNTYEIDNNNNCNIEVPSFIRLFVIRRIIYKYIKDNTKVNSKSTSFMQQLVSSLNVQLQMLKLMLN